MGISLDSLSITSAFNSIVNFFKSQENNSRWKDLTAGAEGTFLIRMLANILSNISYRLVTARRENYISTANLRSSVLGIALNLGYSAHRGTNQKRNIKFEPNSDYVIPPFTTIGSYNDDYDVIYVGEKSDITHLRNGLVLKGPYLLADGKASTVVSISKLTKSITISADVTADIAVGDTILIAGSVPEEGTENADGRYTIASITTQPSDFENNTIITTVEDIPASCIFSQDCTCTRVGVQEFKTVIGKLKTITWTAGTNKTKPFTRFEENISEDCILYLDGEEVPLSSIIRDLNNDTYLIRTNPYSSVDILYLNHIATNTHQYGSESTFMLKYVELADVDTVDYSPNMSGYGTVIDTLTIDNYTPFEDINDIKINAPIDHEVQHLIRSKNDFTQRVQQQIPNVIETAYKSITPTYTLLTYLKDDCTTIQQVDIDGLNDLLEKEKYFGTPNPDIAHPIREAINIVIQVFVTDKLKDSNDIRYDISNIIKTNYSRMLAQTFDTYALERLIEQLSYVKWARVTYDIGEWLSRGITDLGTLIDVNGTIYKASKILGVSGGEVPAWNVPTDIKPLGIDLDDVYETTDGNVIWRAYKKLDIDRLKEHQTSTKYAIGDYVYSRQYPNFMFKVVDLIKNTGATTSPDVSTLEIGDFIADGEIVWVCKEYSSYYPTRQPSTSYRLGSSCNIGTKSFEVVSYIGKTGYISPTFEKDYYEIVNYVTPKVVLDYKLGDGSYFQLAGDQRQLFEIGSTITATTDSGVSRAFTVASTYYNTAGSVNDRTNVYVTENIDTYFQTIYKYASDPTGSYFWLTGNQMSHFRVGDHIKALGTRTTEQGRISVSYDFTVIETKYDNALDDTYLTRIRIKGSLPANIIFETLVEAGYTSIKSRFDNSFIIDGDVSDFFLEGDLIKARTEENAQMTYVVNSSFYQSTFNQTFVMVNQEIASSVGYNRLAPSWVGTEDGEILWKIVDDSTNIKYDWSTYNDIKYKSIIQH